MSARDHYQAIVIGSGQGGTPLCHALAKSGLRTLLIERKHLGGTCVNEGCTPTKTMVASGRVAYLARRGGDYGVRSGDIRIDMERVRQRKRDIVERFRSSIQKGIAKTANLELLDGEARFTGPKSILVRLNADSQLAIAGDRIFINAGARPSVPDLEGLKDVPFLDSTSIMELDALPEHLIVLGGGYVGIEFGQLFRRFGSQVTIVHHGARFLRHEDPDVADGVATILEEDGVKVLLGAKPVRVCQRGSRIHLTVGVGSELAELEGSHLLVATGRTPNTDLLDLSAAGIATDPHGFIQVNERLETSQADVFALGDITGGPAFTHIAYDDFRILRTNLIEGGHRTTADRLVPYTIFIDPQLGRVGLTETEARARKKNVRVARLPMTAVARALEVDEVRGFMKAIVDADTGRILGAAVLGIEGGELMALLQVAMMGNLPYTVLHDAVFAHPTLAESLNNLFKRFDS
jgi:pyruvate/2-oxoglutarate dehydrogenase complex dihydrolipoamide dehydrogenase (E3) component